MPTTSTPKKPQDRLKKAEKPTGYSFTENDVTYTLPPMAENAFDVPGRYTKAAVMRPDDETAQMALAFALLDAADIPAETRAVVEDMPTKRMLEVLGEWMGESAGSSD